jgi:hypothetical protein
MKTTKIDISKVKGNNIFEGALWTKITSNEMQFAFNLNKKIYQKQISKFHK